MPQSKEKNGVGLRGESLLIVILVVATLLRLGAALYLGNSVTPMPGTFDQVSYHQLALQVEAGKGFSFDSNWWPATRAGEPTAHWSFLYTLFLSFVYSVFGTNPLVARLIQAAVAGILHPWLTWRIGNRLFGRPVGALAAALVSVYGYFLYYAGSLMTETFYILAILWSFDIATGMVCEDQRSSRSGTVTASRRWASYVALGLALGVAALFRQLILLFVPVLFLWLGWMSYSLKGQARGFGWLRKSVAGLVVSSAVIVVLVSPWTFRNYRAFDQFVLLNTNAGFAFFWGNHPIQGTNFIPILPKDGPSYQDLIPEELAGLNEAALDRELLRRGLAFVAEDPVRYFRLSASRLREYFKFWPSSESSALSNSVRTLSFGVYLPFMIIGLAVSVGVLGASREGWADTSALRMPLYLFMLVYTLIHLMSWTLIRYRLPVDALLILFAGLGLKVVLQQLALLRRRGRELEIPNELAGGSCD